MKSIIKTIEWKNDKIYLIDQTKLPGKFEIIPINDLKTLAVAIKDLKVRGAPALGVSGAFGILLAAKLSKSKPPSQFLKDIKKTADFLNSTRPTAVNLKWGIDRMVNVVNKNKSLPPKQIYPLLEQETKVIYEEDQKLCRQIGTHGATLIKNGYKIITHCNAGALATADYGTALSCMFKAHEQNKKFEVYADETRPLLQGARLTTWELKKVGIPVTLICDNMAAQTMKQKKIDLVIVGADRIAANGDTANKIGTYGLAILAKHHKVPFYVAAPFSTIDFKTKSGDKIPIENRSPEEITIIGSTKMAPPNTKVFHPAFDVTPANLIAGIITEKGIVKNPTTTKIKQLYNS